MPYAGELAALSTALLWSFTAIFFSEAGKLIGSFSVNKIRLLFAIVIYAVVLTIKTGHPWPGAINLEQLLWLASSGIIGLVFGDGCGFKALVMIGPRLMTIIAASAPIMTTLIAWFFLGERLNWVDIVGIAVTTGGITWVVSERRFGDTNRVHENHPDAGTMTKGVLLALGAALGQAVGLVLSKQGMLNAGGYVPPLEASFVRMIAAAIVIWSFSAMRGTLGTTVAAMKNSRALLLSLFGSICGPFLGVWSSLVAVSLIEAGVAATLNSTTPVLIIPAVIIVYKERISWRAVIGALVTVGGVALLFLK
ncbi:MAG: DMT family transporter [Candidatus Zixiibacteriota bacterium]